MESEPKPFTQISQGKNKHTKIEEKPIKTNMNKEIKSTIKPKYFIGAVKTFIGDK